MKLIVLALLCFVSVVFCDAAISVNFRADANLSTNVIGNNGWQYRKLVVRKGPLGGFAYNSISVAKNGTTRERFQIAGGVRIPRRLSSYVLILNQQDDSAFNFTGNADASASLGFAGVTTGHIYEIDVNGKFIANTNVTLNSWIDSDIGQSSDKDLAYITYSTGVSLAATVQVSITFIVSARVGRTDLADAVVTPRSLESVIAISGYEFQSPGNSLGLVLYAISGSGSVTSGTGVYSGTTFSSSDSNGNSVYVSAANQCYVNGTLSNVTLTVSTVDASVFQAADAEIFSAAQSKYQTSGSLTVERFDIRFPPGAGTDDTIIIYDPTTGSGTPPTNNAPAPSPSPSPSTSSPTTNSSGFVIKASFALCFLALFLAFL